MCSRIRSRSRSGLATATCTWKSLSPATCTTDSAPGSVDQPVEQLVDVHAAVARQMHLDDGLDRPPDRGEIDAGVDAGDHAGLAQRLHAVGARRLRDADARGERGVGHPAVLHERGEDGAIRAVEGDRTRLRNLRRASSCGCLPLWFPRVIMPYCCTFFNPTCNSCEITDHSAWHR